MADNTAIEWADHTFNPWEGCQKVGPGCDNSYAEARNARFGGGVASNWGPGAPRRRTSSANWRKPIAWNAAAAAFAEKHGRRQRVFCASLADVFDNAVDPQWRDDLWRLILDTPDLDWLLLTKRIGNVAGRTPISGMPKNVWLGVTIVNQVEADRDIPKLLETPAAVRFLSCEPLLGPVDLTAIPYGEVLGNAPSYQDALSARIWVPAGSWSGRGHTVGDRKFVDLCTGIDWVIAGGESGPGARPMHPDWARSLRDQCGAAGVPFLFKQWGWCLPGDLEDEDENGHPAWCFGDAVVGEQEWLTPEQEGASGTANARATMFGFAGQDFLRFKRSIHVRLLDGMQHDGFPS